MLDIKLIRSQPELIAENCRKRNVNVDIEKLLKMDEKVRQTTTEVDSFRQCRNEISNKMKAHLSSDERQSLIEESKQLRDQEAKKESLLRELTEQRFDLLKQVPNLTHTDSPEGLTDEDNQPIRQVGEIPDFDEAVERWRKLPSDPGAQYDAIVEIDATKLEPMVTWGTNPGMTSPVTGRVGNPSQADSPADKLAIERALTYMDLEADTAIEDISIDRVFIGSCTNSRLEDIRAAAEVVKGKKVSPKVNAMVVPGSWKIKQDAEAEGLHEILVEAGFEWREAGCSMCLAMNPDKLASGERGASTSNRNFEGRQGPGGRTHLVSPAMAAAAAIAGHFVDIRSWE